MKLNTYGESYGPISLESQTVSLELAKILKQYGVEQGRSQFVHLKTKHAKGIYFATPSIRALLGSEGTEWCDAYTVGEMAELLPDQITDHKTLIIGRWKGMWVARYERVGNQLSSIGGSCRTLADALATTCISLKERTRI